MNITFPDGSVKQFEDGMTALQIAETISQKLKKATLAAEIDGQRADAFRPIHGDHTLKLLPYTGAGREARASGSQACNRPRNRERLLL